MSEYSDLIKAAQEQVMAQNAMEDEYGALQRRNAEESLRRAGNTLYNEAMGTAELNTLNQYREQSNTGDLELQARERIQKLIDNGIEDPNQLYRIIKEDPILSKKYFTDRDTLDVIHQIQDAVVSARNPYNALEGKEIVSDGGFLSNLYHSAKSTFAETAGGLLYNSQKNYQLNKLSGLPLKDLRAIENKLNTQKDLQAKLQVAQKELFSNDAQTRSNALTEVTYLQDAIKGLNLTEQEQNILDTYGKQYFDTKDEITDLTYKQEHLFGANEITRDQANRLVKNAQRDNLYKYSGIEPTFMDNFLHGMKDSLGNPGEELGMILGFAAPLAIGGPLGIAVKGASLLAEAFNTSAQLMEQYIEKHGELPDEKVLSAGIHGLFTAAIDQYLTHGLTVGKGYARGALRGIGLSESARLAEEAAKRSAKALKGLSKGIPVDQQAFAAMRVIQGNIEGGWKTLEESLKRSSRSKALEDIAEEVAGKKGALGKVMDAVSVTKNAKRLKKVNDVLHNKLGTGAQDVLKAGIGLATENAGSTLMRQDYDDTWDMGEVAKSAGQGLVTGGMFHAAGAIPGVAARKGSKAVKEFFDKSNGLDSDSTFKTFTDNIKDSFDKGNLSRKDLLASIDAYAKSHETFQKKVQSLDNENKEIKKNYEKHGLVFDADTGKASVDIATMPEGTTEKQLNKLAKNYNTNLNTINSLSTRVKNRLEELKNLKQTLNDKALEDPRTTAEEKEDIINDIILEGDEEPAIQQVMKQQFVDRPTAKAMVDEYRSRANAKLGEANKSLSEEQQELYKSLKNMVSYTDLYDIRDEAGFKEAIESGDEKQVHDVIDKSSLTLDRKNYLKELLNQDMLDNMGREYGTSDVKPTPSDVTSLDRTTRNAIKKSLLKGSSAKELKDIASKEDAKNFIYNEVLSNKNKLQNEAAIDLALEKIAKADEISDAVKAEVAQEDFRKGLVKELFNTADEHNKYNETLKKYQAKTYSSAEAAKKALEGYHKDASKAYYVAEIENPATGKKQYYIKNNLKDTREKISELRDKFVSDSSMEKDVFFNGIEEIIKTYNQNLDTKEDFSGWLSKAKDKFDKETEGVTDTGVINRTKRDILEDLSNLTVDRLSQNLKRIDTSALSRGKTKIHGYTFSKREVQISRKQLKILREAQQADEEAMKTAEERASNMAPEAMVRFINSAANKIYQEILDRGNSLADALTKIDFSTKLTTSDTNKPLELTRKDVLDIKSFLKVLLAKGNGLEYDGAIQLARNLVQIIETFGITKSNDHTSNSVAYTETGTQLYNTSDKSETVFAAIKRFVDRIPQNSNVFNYNQLPEGLMDTLADYEELVERKKLDTFIENREAFLASLIRGGNTSDKVLKLLELIDNTKGILTKDGRSYSGLEYLAVQYNKDLLDTSLRITVPVRDANGKLNREWAKLFINALTAKNPTLRIMLGIEPGITNAVTKDTLGNYDASRESVLTDNDLNKDNHSLLVWTGSGDTVFSALGLSLSAAPKTLFDKVDALVDGLGDPTLRAIIYAGMNVNSAIAPSVRQQMYTNSHNVYGLSKTITKEKGFIKELVNYISAIPSDQFINTSNAISSVNNYYQTIRERYLNYLKNNSTGTFVDFYNNNIANNPKNKIKDNKLRDAVNRDFSNVIKHAIHQSLINHLNTHINSNKTIDIRTDATYNNFITAIDYVATLPDSMSRYNSFSIINTESATSANLNEYFEVVRQYTLSDRTQRNLTIQDIIAKYNNTSEFTDVTGNVKENATSTSLSRDQIDKIVRAFNPNGSIVGASINTIETLDDSLKIALAKLLARFINERSIPNTFTVTTANTGNAEVFNRLKLRMKASHLSNPIYNSDYYKYIDPRSFNRILSPILNDDLMEVLAQSPNGSILGILRLAEDIIKSGNNFILCENAADKIFGSEYEGRVLYSREMLRGLAIVGMSSLATARTGQSEEWLNTQVSSGRLSQKAANTMRKHNLMDYATFTETLGNTASSLVPLRFRRDAPATLENEVKLGLGVRTLNMLEHSKIVTKQYLNTITGELTTDQPEDLSNVVRVLQVTKSKGTDLSNRINEIDKITGPNGRDSRSILKSLLGEPRDSDAMVSGEIDSNGTSTSIDGYKEEQTRREDKWNDELTVTSPNDLEKHDVMVNGVGYEIHINRVTDTGYVECVSVPTGTTDVFNNSSRYYFIKKQVRKPGGEYISLDAMVEEAYKSSIGYKFKKDKWDKIDRIIKAILNRAHTAGSNDEEAYLHLSADELSLFSMDDPNKVTSIVRQFVFDKNRAIWRQVLQFRDDIKNRGITDKSILYYNVLNTHNNRFYVDSIHLNYREFKLFRELFVPNDPQHAATEYNLTDTEVQKNRDTLYAFVLHNLGAPVDKMSMAEIHQLGEKILDAIKKSTLGVSGFKALATKYDNAFNTGDLNALAQYRKDIDAFFKDIKVKYEKIPGPKGTSFKIDGHNLFTTDILSRLPDLLQSIQDGKEIKNFHYLIEVDGLNNGTSIHYAQSGLFGDNTPLTIDKLISVGVFQGVDVNVNDNGGIVFQDYVEAAYKGKLDAYLQSAAIAGDKSKAQQYRDLLIEQAKNDNKLQDCIVVLGASLGMSTTKYNEVLSKLTDRDIIKYVSMPNSYGAGAEALTNYIYNNIIENCSKYLAALSYDYPDNTLYEKNPKVRFDKAVAMFKALDRFNRKYGDSSSSLILVDFDGNNITLEQAIKEAENNTDKQATFIEKYLPDIGNNKGLSDAFREGIVKHILDGAAHVTMEANRKKVLYGEAIENLMELYVTAVQDIISTDDRFKGKTIRDFTKSDVDFIEHQVTSSFKIGEDEQSLNVFKQAIMPALTMASYRNKVQGFTDTGEFDVASTKDLLSKDINVTGFNPESVHTIDKDIISRAGAELREILGTFVGIHDAAIVDVNQAAEVGQNLNKHYFESTLKSYGLPISMAFEIECAMTRFQKSISPALLAKCQKSISNLRAFATEQASARVRFLQQAIKNDKAWQSDHKLPRTVIKQYAYGKDEFVITEADAIKYIDQIKKEFNDIHMSPLTGLQFLDYAAGRVGTTSTFYKDLKNLMDLVGHTYDFKSIYDVVQLRTGDVKITQSKIFTKHREQFLKLGKKFQDSITKRESGNSIYTELLVSTDTGIEDAHGINADNAVNIIHSARGPLAANQDFIKALRGIFDESILADLFVDEKGNPVQGNNNFLDNFILTHAYKLAGLYGRDGVGIINAIVALTSTSGISNVDLNQLSDMMAGIDTTLCSIEAYEKGKKTVIADFDDVPLKDLLDKFTREARELSAKHNIPMEKALNSIIRNFADGYIDNIARKCNKFKADDPIQIAFKCDTAIDRIVLSVLNERLNNATFRDKVNICIVPNINNVESSTVNRNNHYFAALACKKGSDNLLTKKDNVEVATVLNQSNNKDLTHRNFMYQNQFNAAGLIGKISPNASFVYNYDKASNTTINNKAIGMDPVGIGIADYYGDIQRTMIDGSVTNEALSSFDSYSPNGFSLYQSSVKEYSKLSEQDLANVLRATPNMEQDPGNFDNFYIYRDLSTQEIADLNKDDNLVFEIDSSGELLNSKINRAIIEANPELKKAWENAKNIYDNNSRFFQENTNIDRDSMYPPISSVVYMDGLKINVHFVVNADYKISLQDAYENIQDQKDPMRRGEYLIRHDAPESFTRLFSKDVVERNVGLNNTSHPMNVFLRELYNKAQTTSPELRRDTYISIPKNLRNTNVDTLSTKAKLINSLAMYDILSRNGTTHIFGLNTNSYAYHTSKTPYVYDFNAVKSGDVSIGTVSSSMHNAIANGRNKIMETIRNLVHGYTIDKDHDVLSRFQRAVFTDTNCTDLEDTFDSLAIYDRSNKVSYKDTELCREVFDELKDLNTSIRIAFKDNAIKRNGFAAILDKDPSNDYKPTGYVYLETASNGSNVTTFTHELAHVPLHYLSRDPRSNHMAVEMYNFIADNLRMSDFDCNDDQAKEIYDYLFKDKNTTEPYVECLVMLLTERAFINAVNKMNSRLNFKKEFNDRAKGILNRFLDKIDKNAVDPSNDFHHVAMQILKNSINIANSYQQKAEKPSLGYLSDADSTVAKLNRGFQEAFGKLTNKLRPFTSRISNVNLRAMGAMAQLNMVSPQERNDEVEELMPELINFASNMANVKGSVANEFKQSFEGVSKNNYDYVKLRYKAKEEVDKQREVASTAVNTIVDKLTSKMPTKVLANMSPAVLKTDVSSLLLDRPLNDAKAKYNAKQYLKRTLEDSDYRQNQIENLERQLKKTAYGNFYINAARGLANKLVYGVNSSGIGYNNAYEIANLCGTSNATISSTLESTIDKYVTLRAMQLYANEHSDYVYSYLADNINDFYELSVMHNTLKDMERNTVYKDSLQKYHIPKGELHGSSRENSYALVPESDVKAYEWLGYKKIKKAKLDTFYNRLTTEPYYVMEGRNLPNVPYVSGIPVLSDIFNGRNKSGINIDGSRLASSHISDKYNHSEFTQVSKYMDSLINRLNDPRYKVRTGKDTRKDMDGVITPTYGFGNRLTGADFEINDRLKNKILGLDHKYTTALGDHYGSIIERTKAPEWNTKAAEALDEIYLARRDSSKFTWLTSTNEDANLVEIYNLLPYEIKNYFNTKYGNSGVPVETRYLTGITGYKEASANKIDTKYYKKKDELKDEFETEEQLNAYVKFRDSTMGYLNHLFHSGPMAKLENTARWLTRIGKLNVVVRSCTVSLNNIASNCVTLGVLGLNPTKVCQYQTEGLNELLKFKELRKEKAMLEAKSVSGVLSDIDRAKIRNIDSALNNSLIGYMADKGGLPTVAEDISQPDRLLKDSIDRYTPRQLQGLLHKATGDEKSWLLQTLTDLSSFGDITARYAQLKYLTEDQNLDKDEAYRQCMQTFIDYSNPLPKGIQYFDSIGALPFTKFLLGNQTNVLNSITKNPTGALSWIAANSYMNVSDIYGSILGFDSITDRWKLPGFGLFYDSLASLPIMKGTKAALDIL